MLGWARVAGIVPAILIGAAGTLLRAQSPPPRATHTPNAIIGKVTNAAGQPVSGVGVTAIVRAEQQGQTRFNIAMANLLALTDEHGEYRIDNARIGDFLVVAIPHNTPLGPDGRPNRSGYGVTYYPSAKTPETAMPVTVNVRAPAPANITLSNAPLAVIAGTVLDHQGHPAAGQRLLIAHGDHLFGVDARAVQLRDDGTFALAGMPPGTYFLQMREGQWPPPRDVETPLISGAQVVVEGKDATGVRVVPIHMVKASGRILADPAGRDTLKPSMIRVVGIPLNFEGNPGPERPGSVTDDFRFDFRTWPGPHAIRVTIDSQAWTVKAIRYKGADITTGGIDFRDGEEITGLEIELARAGSNRQP